MRLIFFWITASWLLVSPCLAWQPTPAPGQGSVTVNRQNLSALFLEIAAAETSLPIKDLRLTNFAIDPEQVSIPAGTISYQLLSSSPNQYPGRKFFSIQLTNNGEPQAIIKMHGDIRFYGEIVCASRPLPKHHILTSKDLTTSYRDISMLADKFIRDPQQIIGQQTTTSLQQGNMVRPDSIQPRPLIKRGELITIRARGHNLLITAPGKAQAKGAKGEIIKVKNMMSRRTIFARVIATGLVEVSL